MRRPVLTFLVAAFVGMAEPAGSPAAEPVALRFSLTDQTGTIRSAGDFGDAYLLIVFGYTHCPDICPTALAELSLVLQRLPARLQQKVKVVFVSADPERDTPAVLRQYLGSFDSRIIGFTGSAQAVDDLAWSMQSVILRHGSPADGDYPVDHSTFYTLVNKGRIIARLDDQLTPDAIVARLGAAIPD